jgi:hypothetical protein
MMKKNKSLNELANNTRNRFVAIAIDETEYWSEEIQQIAGKIESVYLVNLKMPTHLCEFAISFPAVHLRNFVPDIEKFENGSDNLLLQDIEGQYDEQISYFKGSSVFDVKYIYNYAMTEEEAIERESANPSYC